jgi:putative colanic acid biosynthesis glycosyltransferase
MNNRKPFFSIITVVLNDLDGLEKTRDSLVTQKFRNIEWIVVDGGSKDGSSEYADSEKNLIIKLMIEKDSGIYDAMNKGVSLCSGNFILFLNAGDELPNDLALLQVSKFLLKNKKVEIIFGGANLIFPNGKSVYREPRDINNYIWHGIPANHQATYFRREVIRNFPYDLGYRICGDYYIMAKLFKKGVNAEYMNTPLVNFEVGGISLKTPSKLFYEPYLIQRDILNVPLVLRIMSLLKRIIATFGTFILFRLDPIWPLFKIVQRL